MARIDEEPVGHPLADALVDGGVVHRDPVLLLELTPLRSDLLVTAARADLRPVLHTSAQARMSPALVAALADVRGRWLVEGPAGTCWDGITGVVVDPDLPLVPPDLDARTAPAFAPGRPADATEVVLAASIRHRSGSDAPYGALLESFTAALGAPPAAYGPHEPMERRWDRAELQALLDRLPDPLRLLVRGEPEAPMCGSLLVRRTAVGTEEVVDAVVADGPEDLPNRVRTALEQVASDSFVLFAVVLARPGHRDLMRRPVLPHAPVPLAVLIGPPGLRDLGVDLDVLVRRFGAVRVGRPRIPSLLVPFSGEAEDWAIVDDLVQVLGSDRVAAAFGRRERP